MSVLPTKVISKLQENTKNVRNICVLAHVDHGKTSLCDALIASNGIISKKLTGKVRYLDYRDDEQLRQITMKSTAISLYAQHETEHHLLNLVDSPGHIDFSGEVSSAVRVTDGALIVVDCVEGVCVQTQMVLRQAASEGLEMVLVINKIDRLIFEKDFSIEEATEYLERLLTSVNSVVAIITGNKEDQDDYFSPAVGNVVFCSAIDGWGFDVSSIATIYSERFGLQNDVLKAMIWGEHYINPKTGKSYKNAVEGTSKIFTQLALKPVWDIYNSVRLYFVKETRNEAKQKILRIASALKMKITERDLAIHEEKSFLFTMMSAFLPITTPVLRAAITHLPNPLIAQQQRLSKIYSSPSNYLKENVSVCDSKSPECVLYAAKIYPFHGEMLALCRVFSGTLTKGMNLYILPPTYDPDTQPDKIEQLTVDRVLLLMGQEVQEVDSIPSGNVAGIPVKNLIFKAATLSTTPLCTPFAALTSTSSKPVLVVAIEPNQPTDMTTLVNGLHTLSLSDPSVATSQLDTGELLLHTTGELHLERCLKDLRDLFVKIPFTTSSPLVTYRETLLNQTEEVTNSTVDDTITITVHLSSLAPESVDSINQLHPELHNAKTSGNFKETTAEKVKEILRKETRKKKEALPEDLICCGPKKTGANVLLFSPDVQNTLKIDSQNAILNGLITGFQLATSSGPLCGEAMEGVAVVVDDVDISEDAIVGKSQGMVISAFKDAIIEAFESGAMRLKEPVYDCEVRSPPDSIIMEDFDEIQGLCIVNAWLPVSESFGATSGAAFAQLSFLKFVMMNDDPFWVPTTEDELLEFGEKVDFKNVAREALDKTRRRKGLILDEKIVEFVDKQSTRSKKK
ncbi:Elongation factor-like 1 [Entamoeba marina]